MSATSETTYTWCCDLCGKNAGITDFHASPPAGLTRIEVVDKNKRGSVGLGPATRTADICTDCMKRPIADLTEFTAGKPAGGAS